MPAIVMPSRAGALFSDMDLQVAAAAMRDVRYGEVPPPLPTSFWDRPHPNLVDDRLPPTSYTRAALRSPLHLPRPAALSPALPLPMRYNVVTSAEHAAAFAPCKRSHAGQPVQAPSGYAARFNDLHSGLPPPPGFADYRLAPATASDAPPLYGAAAAPLDLAHQLADACGRFGKRSTRQPGALSFEVLPGVEAGGVPLSMLNGNDSARLPLSKYDPAITGADYDAFSSYRAVYGADKYDASGSVERALGRGYPERLPAARAAMQQFPRPIPPRHAALSSIYGAERYEDELGGAVAPRFDEVFGADKYGSGLGSARREVGRSPVCGQPRSGALAPERAPYWDGRAGDEGAGAHWQGVVARELARELADKPEAFDVWVRARSRHEAVDALENGARLSPQQLGVRGDAGGLDAVAPCTAVRPALHPISRRLPTDLDVRWVTESCETMQPPSPPIGFDPAPFKPQFEPHFEPAPRNPPPALQHPLHEAALARGWQHVFKDTDGSRSGKVPSAAACCAFSPCTPMSANFGVVERPAHAHVNLPSRLFDGSSHSDQATTAVAVPELTKPPAAAEAQPAASSAAGLAATPPLLPVNMCYVNESDVVVQKEIGRGSFGMVTYQELEPFGAVAIKWMRPDKRSSSHLSGLLSEAQVLAELNHPNVLRMYGAVLDAARNPVGFVTEYCELGSLAGYLHNAANPALTLRQRLELGIHTARGLACLHDRPGRPLVHFDVKPENLLLVRSGTGVSVKVADFGLSKYKLDTYVTGVDDVRGTLPYMAPEVVRAPDTITEAIDVWSFGVVMWEMFTRESPFGQMSLDAIISGLRAGTLCVEVPNGCEDEWGYIMAECLKLDPRRRPRMSQVLDMLKRVLAQLPP